MESQMLKHLIFWYGGSSAKWFEVPTISFCIALDAFRRDHAIKILLRAVYIAVVLVKNTVIISNPLDAVTCTRCHPTVHTPATGINFSPRSTYAVFFCQRKKRNKNLLGDARPWQAWINLVMWGRPAGCADRWGICSIDRSFFQQWGSRTE